jgi:hypothetical protein
MSLRSLGDGGGRNLFVERIEKLLWIGGGLLTYSTKAVYI